MLLSSFPDRQAYLRPSAISETAESQVGKHIIKSRSKHPAMLPHHYSSYASSGTVRLKALSSSSVSLSYGGYGTRMSHSSAKVDTTHDFIFDNEKMILQNLNRRMAAYLDKVRSLEAANRRIELQIKEWYERRSTTYCKDLTHYYSTTEELCEQINSHAKENALLFLQVKVSRVTSSTAEVKTSHTLVSDLKKTYQQRKMELDSLLETKKEVTAKKHAPHIQRRVKIIVEKLVDGEVVSVDKTEKLEEVIN
uniref:IF rod domain-containing protein n=1 Tax=Electrophorus electricus TaxID=8005 RepID=A0A4W4G0Q9_ELEEL